MWVICQPTGVIIYCVGFLRCSFCWNGQCKKPQNAGRVKVMALTHFFIIIPMRGPIEIINKSPMEKSHGRGSVANFINEVVKFKIDSSQSVLFFRGQPMIDQDLLPTIFRAENKQLLNKEQRLFEELKSYFPIEFENHNTLDNLMKAQHYGIPTRLLDVTLNPLVALFFACNRSKQFKGNSAVYAFAVDKNKIMYADDGYVNILLEKAMESHGNAEADSDFIPLKGKFSNARIIRQQGCFFLFLNNKPMEETSNWIKKIVISHSHRSKMLDELRLLGISRETMFPELTAYAEALKASEIIL